MIKKLFVVGSIAFCHLAFADCLIYESKEYANEGAKAYRESCENYGGGGGKFSYSVSESSSNNTCDGVFVENAFVLRVSCNTCNSLEMKEELEENKKYCNKICKTAMMTCMTVMNAWGSTLNGSRESCGLDDHTLPGCEESSSSFESSSSEVYSSSSSSEIKSSTSEAMSSNITNNTFGYTEGLRLCPTEATYYFNLYGNYCKETDFCKCYNSNTTRIKFFTKRPDYYGQLEYSLLCFVRQSNPNIMIRTNLPYVTVVNNAIAYCFNDIETCEQNWNSNYVTYARIPTIYSCRANTLNYTVPVDPARGCSVTKNTDNDSYGMIFLGLGVTETSTLSDLTWLADANSDQLPANFNFDDLLNRSEIVSSFERCVSELKYYNSIKSSSSQFSSSSGESSSSSELELYSSSLEEDGSISEGSSSSEEISSSSEYGLCKSLPFGYIPNDPKSTCFESNGKCYRCNAARRTDECDKDWMWIYPYTPDKYFFTEIDCESGERKDDNRIGQCPGFPLEDVPNHPEEACVAYNGKCYRCNPARGSECAYSWLWTGGSFGTHNIGYYYEQVDCYDPFGDEEEILVDGCADESVLRKVSAREYYHDSDNAVNDYSVVLTKHVKKYDALGRHGINKQPSHMALYKTNMSISQRKIETSVTLQIPSISSADYCDRDSSGRWNCNKNKKGLKKRVWSVNQFVDPTRCDIKKGRDYWYFIKNTDPVTGKEISKTYFGGVTCAWPNVSINHEPKPHKNELIYSNGKIVGVKATVEYRFYTHTTLGENNYIIMKAGDVFSDGHVVTSADEMCYEKHEQGHEKYNECVSYEEVEETGTFECTVMVSGAMSEAEMTKKINDAVIADLTIKRNLFEKQHLQDRLNKAQEKLDKSRDLFHADFGTDGYAGKNDKLPKSYVCPNF